MLWRFCILLFLGIGATSAQAQVEIDRSVLEGYKPPPMFGAPPASAAPEPAQPEPYNPPPTPSYQDIEPLPEPEKVVRSAPPPLPEAKPAAPARKISRAVPKEPKEKKRPGVVTGPKTMPAVPSEDVSGETTYRAAQSAKDKTMLERHQEQVKIEEEPPEIASIEPVMDVLSDIEGGNKKLTMPFAASQTDLGTKHSGPLRSSIAAFLAQNPDWRVQIQSFASSQDAGVSSDRRIALSRALAIRTFLIGQQIEASRIDVRALGAQTDIKPVDRVDIYLMNPGQAG